MSLKTIVKASANRHCLVVQTDLSTIGPTKAPQSKFSHDLHITVSIEVLHASLLHSKKRTTCSGLMNTAMNNVVLPTLFKVVNNTEQVDEPELACNQV